MTEPTPATDVQLPHDPDLEVDETTSEQPRPVHLRPVYLLLVFAGGTVGVAAREALTLAFPPIHGIPFTIFAINMVGAFLLGVLLDALARRGPDRGKRRALRLLLGTGVIGGFTTYSALAADTASLLGSDAVAVGVGYSILTVLIGAACTWAGIGVAALTHRAPRDGENR